MTFFLFSNNKIKIYIKKTLEKANNLIIIYQIVFCKEYLKNRNKYMIIELSKLNFIKKKDSISRILKRSSYFWGKIKFYHLI